MRILSSILAAGLTMAGGSAATAATYTVSAFASGSFGYLNSFASPFVAGPSMVAGETVEITVTGTINLGNGITGVTADGFDNPTGIGVSDNEFTPLEEVVVDANPAAANTPGMQDMGALIGSFVPVDIVTAPGFSAIDEDFGGDLTAESLFYLGASFEYTATEDGILYFGINEPWVFNNTGAFTVSVTSLGVSAVVPLPAGLPLLALGLGGLALLGRRRAAPGIAVG